jgi:hypothetical protein
VASQSRDRLKKTLAWLRKFAEAEDGTARTIPLPEEWGLLGIVPLLTLLMVCAAECTLAACGMNLERFAHLLLLSVAVWALVCEIMRRAQKANEQDSREL